MREYIFPEWPNPDCISSASTTREGGLSSGAYGSFNLSQNVGDDEKNVHANRCLLKSDLELPELPIWCRQVHGRRVVLANECTEETEADAIISSTPGEVCAILTADCLPVLLCDRAGSVVAAIHAGWRGLLAGVIGNTISRMKCKREHLMAWLGPSIGPQGFIVGPEVKEEFVASSEEHKAGFTAVAGGKWMGNLVSLARQILNREGVNKIYGGHWCTWTASDRFFSYRRDGNTGRMSSFIWINSQH